MGKKGTMSTRTLAIAAGGLAAVLTVAPARALYSQTPQPQTPQQDSAARRTWPSVPRLPTRTTTGATAPTTADTGRLAAMADSSFVRDATLGSLWEMRLGTLAEQKASSSAVKDFAKRMVSDHTSMWKQWTSLARKNGLPVNSTLQPEQQQSVTQLGTASGAEFDNAYMTAMVQAHQRDATMFQQLGPSARSSEVQQLASSGLATIQQHLSMAQQVASQIGAPTAVATNPAVTPPAAPAAPNGKANTPRNEKGQKNARADGQYVTEVAYGHIMETRLAQLAQKKAKDPQVKQFADRMFDDFNKWMGRWSELASKSGAPFNPNMGPKHQEKIDRLQKASPNQFDRTYLDIVTENLKSMVPYFQKEGRAAQTAKVRNMVNEELPTLQQNLNVAERLSRTSQASAKANGKGKSLSSNK
jgi:putative membrane protein